MANHVSHGSIPYPIRNARYTVLTAYLDADGDPTDPTTPDTEVSQDGGAFADAAEEVTTISGSNGMGYITLSGAETNNSLVGLAFKVASGPKATLMTLYPRNLPILGSGTLSAGSAGGGTLGTVLAYDITGCFIRTTGGTGGGGTGGANNQARRIITYTVSTGAFTVSPNWETTPSTDTTYDVLCPEGVTPAMLKALNPTTAGRTLVVDANGLADANAVKLGPTGSGTAQTARDIGASVLLSSGTGTGQLDFTSGVVKANLAQILGTALTETSGQIAAAFKQFFDVASPTGTMKAITNVVTTTTATNLTTNNDKTGYALSSAGVQAIWDALTSALTTVGSVGKRIADNLDVVLSTRAAATALTTAQADLDDIQTRLPSALVSGRMDTSVGAMAADVVTAAAIATNAIDADAMAVSALAEIQSGLAQASLLAVAQADLDDIQTRLPAALVGGRMDSSVGAMAAGVVTATAVATDAIDADALASDAVTEIQSGLATTANITVIENHLSAQDEAAYLYLGTVVSSTASTVVLDSGASSVDDYYTGALMSIPYPGGGNAGNGQSRLITGYVGATRTATIVPNWITNPVADCNVSIEPWGRVDLALWKGTAPNALQSGRVDSYIGAVAAGAIAAASFAAGALDAVWSTATRLLTAGTNIVLAKGTGVTGFNDLSAAQVNTEADTALADVGLTTTVTGRIDVAVSSRLATVGYTAPPTVGAIADQVWDETAADHLVVGSTGEALADAGGAGTPPTVAEIADGVWDEARAGHVGAGSFGQGVASVQGNVTGSVGSLTTNNDKTGYALTSAYDPAKTAAQAGDAMALTSGERTTLAAAIWNALTSGLTTVGSIGKRLADDIDAAISSRSTYAGGDTAGTTTLLARIPGTVQPQTGDSFARLGAPAGASVSVDVAAVKSDSSAVKTVTDQLVAAQAEPSSVPAANASPLAKLAWLAVLSRNKILQTPTTQTVRNDGDSADIATSVVSDDGTTFIRGEFS